MIIIFDTETTGFFNNSPLDDPSQPHIVQLGAILKDGPVVRGEINLIVKPEGWEVPEGAAKVHGLTTELASKYGLPLKLVMYAFEGLLMKSELKVAHNLQYDDKIIQIAHARLKMKSVFTQKPSFCTMQATTNICKIPGKRGGYKWPSLTEAYTHFFGHGFEGAHGADFDTKACMEVYGKLTELGLV